MIKATVEQCVEAHRALRRINEEVRLTQKAAWRVARLLNLLKPVVRDFMEASTKIYIDAGGHHRDVGVRIEEPVRADEEPATTWSTRLSEHREKVNELVRSVKSLNDEEVEIAYDPLPLSLFDDDEKTPAEKRRQFSANDFADLGPFLAEEQKSG